MQVDSAGIQWMVTDVIVPTHLSLVETVAQVSKIMIILSYDIASGSEITPCNKIDKPLVVYRFMTNVMRSITALHT